MKLLHFTPAALVYPGVIDPNWLLSVDQWSIRTGRDLLALEPHEIPCTLCDGVLDKRDLASVAEHEHNGQVVAPGQYLGTPSTPAVSG